ncbi:hypothetical protein BC827DRAFT_1158396 [Russula dissimulans]|nr:hypothetical protein BC827DRAFT_1158396 [Russula dissimulans]
MSPMSPKVLRRVWALLTSPFLTISRYWAHSFNGTTRDAKWLSPSTYPRTKRFKCGLPAPAPYAPPILHSGQSDSTMGGQRSPAGTPWHHRLRHRRGRPHARIAPHLCTPCLSVRSAQGAVSRRCQYRPGQLELRSAAGGGSARPSSSRPGQAPSVGSARPSPSPPARARSPLGPR